LQPAPDAEILDTTNLGIPEVEDRVRRLLQVRGIG
jgi:cytidylate kinase